MFLIPVGLTFKTRYPILKTCDKPEDNMRKNTDDQSADQMATEEKIQRWFIPLSNSDQTLRSAFDQLKGFGLKQGRSSLYNSTGGKPEIRSGPVVTFFTAARISIHTITFTSFSDGDC